MGVGGGRGVKEVGETVAASLEVIVVKILIMCGIPWSPRRQSVNVFLQKPMLRSTSTAPWNH